MRQIAAFLVFLLLILTFNAYACVLPLQTVSEKDCSSEPEEQARQTCDAFLVIGPQSQPFANHPASLFTFEDAAPIQLRVTFNPVLTPTPPPRNAVSPIHLSIPITVLRI